MGMTIAEMSADELGDIIKKAVVAALWEHYQRTDIRAKKADEIGRKLITE